jgi:very-short-patch-repair endonuclease
VKESHLVYTKENKENWVECPLCSYRAETLQTHYKMHNVSAKEYRIVTNNMQLKNERLADKFRGKNNPAYAHGGKFSPWSSKSIVHNEEIVKIAKSKAKLNNPTLNDKSRNAFCREYYNSDFEYKKAQTKNLNWFTTKYGTEIGTKKYSMKTEKWIKNFKKQNYSKISQELFNEIVKLYISENIYYATYDRSDMKKYKNKEFRLMIENRGLLLDFVDVKTKKVIEFDGDYWHSESRVNPTREKFREELLIKDGYKLLRIREKDYKKDKQGTIDKCINFLTQ